MNLTENYGLKKPLEEEGYNINDFNTNADLIDSALARIEQEIQDQDSISTIKEDLEAHIEDKENPHEITLEKLGIGNVEDKSSSMIRGEITKENVTDALGYIPYTPNEIDNKLSALETNIDWKESVAAYDDIATTYPAPQDGWTVNVKDTDYTYRYNGTSWVVISANAIPKATNSVDGLLSKEDHANYEAAKQHADSVHAPTNAERNTIIGIQKNGTDISVSSARKVNITVPTKISELNNDSGYITDAGVTSVNGQTEDVNLTAADIEALSLTGGTITGDLRLKGNGNYGNKINFGDSDYVHISEPSDDHLEIKGSYINFVVPNINTGRFTVNGNDIYTPNTLERNGYVLKGEGHPNQVWKTDSDGNPGWRPESKGFYVTFADGTWNEIKIMLELHYAGEIDIADYWAVGDEKTITLPAMAATGVGESHTEQEIKLVIVGIEHDDLTSSINSKSKAAVTVGLKTMLLEGGYMNSSKTNTGAWGACARRPWCNTVFYNALPEGLRTLIKTVDKKCASWTTSDVLVTTEDLCWMPSMREVNLLTETHPYNQEGDPYSYYKTDSNRVKADNRGNNLVWWSRSFNYGGSTGFKAVNDDGAVTQWNADSRLGLAPHFCI